MHPKQDKMKPWLLFSLAALTMISCAKPKDLEYVEFRNLKVKQWGLLESTVGMEIAFFNPNRSRVQLKDAEVDVYINNTFLGKSLLDTLVRIPAKDTFLVPVTMRVGTGSALTNILKLVSDTSVLIRMEGNAKFGKGGVFLNYPIRYEGRQNIRF